MNIPHNLTETVCPSFLPGNEFDLFRNVSTLSLKAVQDDAFLNLISLTAPDFRSTTRTWVVPSPKAHFPYVWGLGFEVICGFRQPRSFYKLCRPAF